MLQVDYEFWRSEASGKVWYYSLPDTTELGYRIIYDVDKEWIYNVAGRYLTTLYLDLPNDTLVKQELHSSHSFQEHFIRGGLVKLSTKYGDLDCIETKTVWNPDDPSMIRYSYHSKDMGIVRINEHLKYTFENGEDYFPLIRRFNILDYHLK